MKLLFFQTVKSKVIISLFETVRLSVSISLRNLYNSSNSIKETIVTTLVLLLLTASTIASTATDSYYKKIKQK